jgi:hypothetical protein
VVHLNTVSLSCFHFHGSVVAKFSGNIPKGPTCVTLWCKDPSLSVEDQNEYLEESSNLITASFESLQTETFEICDGQLVQYLKLDLRLANRTIQKHLSKLGYDNYLHLYIIFKQLKHLNVNHLHCIEYVLSITLLHVSGFKHLSLYCIFTNNMIDHRVGFLFAIIITVFISQGICVV